MMRFRPECAAFSWADARLPLSKPIARPQAL